MAFVPPPSQAEEEQRAMQWRLEQMKRREKVLQIKLKLIPPPGPVSDLYAGLTALILANTQGKDDNADGRYYDEQQFNA